MTVAKSGESEGSERSGEARDSQATATEEERSAELATSEPAGVVAGAETVANTATLGAPGASSAAPVAADADADADTDTDTVTDVDTVTDAPAAAGPRSRPPLAVWIATAGGVGFGPWAPGTWGALEAVILFVLFLSQLSLAAYAALVVVLSIVGVWASGASETYFGKHDDGRIVIDEVVGQLITLMPLLGLRHVPLGRIGLPEAWIAPGSAWTGGIDAYFLLVVTAFVAFRWFDIRKPGLVRWAEERFPGGMGVMADDMVAGVMGAVVVMAPAYVLVIGYLLDHASTLSTPSTLAALLEAGRLAFAAVVGGGLG